MFKSTWIGPYFLIKVTEGETYMKMTKDEAKAIARKAIEHSKKYSIPLKAKKKKTS